MYSFNIYCMSNIMLYMKTYIQLLGITILLSFSYANMLNHFSMYHNLIIASDHVVYMQTMKENVL